jgi:hypothetical protein
MRPLQANPRGVFVSSTIIVQFHHTFLTKVDRAYRIECFYREKELNVSSDINVRCD